MQTSREKHKCHDIITYNLYNIVQYCNHKLFFDNSLLKSNFICNATACFGKERVVLFSNSPVNIFNLNSTDDNLDFLSTVWQLAQNLHNQEQDNPVIPKNILGSPQNPTDNYISLPEEKESPYAEYLRQMKFEDIVKKTHDKSLDLQGIIYELGFEKFLEILDEKGTYIQDVINADLLDFRTYDVSGLEEIAESEYLETLLQYPHVIRQLFLRDDIPQIQNNIINSFKIDKSIPERLQNGEDCMPFFPLNIESFYYYAGGGMETEIPSIEYNEILSQFLIKDTRYKHNNDKIGYFSKLYRLDSEYLKSLRSGIYEYYEADPNASDEPHQLHMKERTKALSDILKTVKTDGEITLYRGLDNFRSIRYMADGPITELGNDNIQDIIGTELFDRSFTSYSIKESVAQFYAQSCSMEDRQTKVSTPIVKLTIPNEKSINAMPIGNSNEEVVLNRYQKMKVTSIDYDVQNEEGDYYTYINCELGDDSGKIEEQVYKTPKFKKYQEEFEINLGKYLYKKEGCNKNGKAYKAVQYAINHIRNKYIKKPDAAKTDRKTFYSNENYNNPYYPGSISGYGGRGLDDEEINAVLSEGIPTKNQLKRNNKLAHGTFREKMLALMSALDNPDDISEFYDDPDEPVIYAHEIPKEEQAISGRDLDYQDQMGLTRSQRERDYQENNQLTNHKSPITYNKMKYTPIIHTVTERDRIELQQNPKFIETPVDSFYGKRLIGGTSEIAMNLLSEYKKYINPNKIQLLNFRLAIMAYMLPEEIHSLYEILAGSHQAEVQGYENLSTADTMDRSIDPLSEETLKNVPEVCKDGLFPYERAYRDLYF